MKTTRLPKDRPVRILHVEYGIGFGGSVVSLSELIRGLTTLGRSTSTVATFQSPEIVGGLFATGSVRFLRSYLDYIMRDTLSRFMQAGPIRRIFLTPAMKGYAFLDLIHERWLGHRLVRLGREARADVIHANNRLVPSALFAARALGVPCIIHFRGIQRTHQNNVRDRYGALAAVVSRYVAISDVVAESVIAFGAPAELTVTIHNPVSLQPYEISAAVREAVRRQWGIGPSDLVIAVFGRVTPWKGQLEFLADVRPLLEAFPEMRILIVGDESDSANPSYSQQVKAMAGQPELVGRIILSGYQQQVPAYYAAADVVVHCSREPEPFGRVVIEGMAAGKPVVAMREAGPIEIITDGIDGVLVAPRNPQAMRMVLSELRNDPEYRMRIGAAARNTIRERFTPEVAATRFLDALHGEDSIP